MDLSRFNVKYSKWGGERLEADAPWLLQAIYINTHADTNSLNLKEQFTLKGESSLNSFPI